MKQYTKKVLVGIIMDGTAGGVDRYILNFFEQVRGESCKVDFLTNIPENPLAEKVAPYGS